MPIGVDMHRAAEGPTVFVEEREDWYGNSAHDIQREREAIEARPSDLVHRQAIVEDENWYGNNAHHRARDAEANLASVSRPPESTADGSGLEHQTKTNGSATGADCTAADPGASG